MLAGLACLLAAPNAAYAAGSREDSGTSPAWMAKPAAARPLEPGQLEAFVDGFVAAEREGGAIAGAFVSVVDGGKPVLSKGYGYADIEQDVAVTPARTLFRLGSTSKLFTWISVMQQVEEGKLDLHADVNQYIDQFSIPATYEHPVTLWHLMTHTGGFEDGWAGFLIVRNGDRVQPLSEALDEHRPARVRPAWEAGHRLASSYSNWGAALAGLIVANVSGLSFPDYVRSHIFEPLGMQSSTFEEPLPEPLAARLSKGYFRSGSRLQEGWMEYLGTYAPAGAISSTAADMTRFLLMLTNGGELDGQRILRRDTLRDMLSPVYRPGEYVPAMGLGFDEYHVNGRSLFGHGGDTPFFHTELAVLPEENFAFLFSVNTAQAGMIPRRFMQVLMDRYFPGRLPELKSGASAPAELDRFAGAYRSIRRSYSKNEKLLALPKELEVTAAGDGTLTLEEFGEQRTFVPVEPGVFREAASDQVIEFVVGENRQVAGMVGMGTFERLDWFETRGFHLLLNSALVLVFLIALVRPLTGLGRRAVMSGPSAPSGPTALALRASAILAALCLLDIVLLGQILLQSPIDLANAFPTSFRTGLTLALVLIVALLAVSAILLWGLARGRLRGPSSYFCWLYVLAVAAFIWELAYWNLIGFQFA